MNSYTNPPPYSQFQESPGYNVNQVSHGGFGKSTAPLQEQPLTHQPLAPVAPPATTVLQLNNYISTGPGSGHGAICSSCNANVRVRVKNHASWITYLISTCLCLFLCWPCVCSPCRHNWCYKTSHFCPNCNVLLDSFYC